MMRSKSTPTEHQETVLLADWLRVRGIPFLHIPNEGRRSYQMARRLKAEGLQTGAPDILIYRTAPLGGHKGVAIEMKRATRKLHRKGGLTESQEAMLASFANEGWLAFVAYGGEEAIKKLQELGY